jgi:hypothetical protein
MNKQRPIDHAAMARAVAGLETKSDKIRALGAAGFPRTDIARFLDIRYQHVRNVLVHAEESAAAYDANKPLPAGLWVAVAADGRMVLPPVYRPLLDVAKGGSVFLQPDGGVVHMKSSERALKDVQDLVTRFSRGKGSLVDALLADRTAEAAREERGE